MRVTKLESLLSREDLSHALFLSVAVWVADATYAGTDAFQKRTLSGSANQCGSVFVARCTNARVTCL